MYNADFDPDRLPDRLRSTSAASADIDRASADIDRASVYVSDGGGRG